MKNGIFNYFDPAMRRYSGGNLRYFIRNKTPNFYRIF